jgi:hypothetical protein
MAFTTPVPSGDEKRYYGFGVGDIILGIGVATS